ncbi:unnamed protein product, partial [Iphiclides podalirius]
MVVDTSPLIQVTAAHGSHPIRLSVKGTKQHDDLCTAEESLRRNLHVSLNYTKFLSESVCSEIFPDEQSAFRCQEKFLSPTRNITNHPPELSIKCQSKDSVTFMISSSVNQKLVVPVPQEEDSRYIKPILMNNFEKFVKISSMPRGVTFWTTALNADGSPSLWQKGPEVGVWEKSRINQIRHKELDSCFEVINYCNTDTQGNIFYKNIQPDNNRSVVIGNLPLGDSCMFTVKGKYGITELEYQTPECFEIKECAPLPEISNVTVEVSESASGQGWSVRALWQTPRVTPNYYSVTLFADTEYNLTLPGNSTEALFEEVTEEGMFYVAVSATTASGTAHAGLPVFLPPLEGQTLTVGLLVGAAWLVALMFVLVASLFAYCKERRSRKVKFDYLQHFQSKYLKEELCKEGALEALSREPEGDRWEVRGSRLTLHEVVGEGAFGTVRRATLAPGRQVAVKMLKDFPTADEVRSFRAEMELMKSVGAHPHVVSLVGCCSGRRPLIIAEYCSLGDLLTFLRCSWDVMLSKRKAKCAVTNAGLEYRSGLLKETGGCGNGAVANKLYELQGACEELTYADLLSFCRQIAMGMQFLASNRVVHRDLAARNVLVAGDRTLKVADFGLSRDVYQENQYRQKGNGKMPVKWMAPESLTHRIFTTQSDVWSFGVVMWEVVTVGGAPYPAVAAARLPRLLRNGYRMHRPANCTPQLYEVMMSCWKARPCERPTFGQLHAQLDALLAAACADRYLALDLPVDLPSVPSLPQLPLTHTLLKSKDVWDRVSYEKSSALSNHYTSTPVTQLS